VVQIPGGSSQRGTFSLPGQTILQFFICSLLQRRTWISITLVVGS
jgi:hypothetical protein